MKTIERIRDIARTLPVFDAIKNGEVKDKCVPFSRQLHGALLDAGIPAIMVGGDARTGKIEHNYLFCKTEEGIRLVDPTAAMYIPILKGDIYIGTRNELINLGRASDPSRNWDLVWAEAPMLWRRGTYPASDKEQKMLDTEWGSTGVRINPGQLSQGRLNR